MALLVARSEEEAGTRERKSHVCSIPCVSIIPIVMLRRMAFGFIRTRKLRLREVNPVAWDR